ncbi:hypothetical protein POVCU2_0032010 [Plasmodium ovale curtisi]|uniref:Uncharacterized protein n=1 Tax=Plasmodium ovale curtisi TaxID=864141 RepID=A0A1A8W309_PLAOA|nr:hypothetical protein POVCU2_0032010 [Plasmodium ovale curtisi]SBS95322.1 hypothetical protein POVCU1_029410 [Plasmodium ovale curtisi]
MSALSRRCLYPISICHSVHGRRDTREHDGKMFTRCYFVNKIENSARSSNGSRRGSVRKDKSEEHTSTRLHSRVYTHVSICICIHIYQNVGTLSRCKRHQSTSLCVISVERLQTV